MNAQSGQNVQGAPVPPEAHRPRREGAAYSAPAQQPAQANLNIAAPIAAYQVPPAFEAQSMLHSSAQAQWDLQPSEGMPSY